VVRRSLPHPVTVQQLELPARATEYLDIEALPVLVVVAYLPFLVTTIQQAAVWLS
jgi:hypothetical protein